jgi:hypothetical protein
VRRSRLKTLLNASGQTQLLETLAVALSIIVSPLGAISLGLLRKNWIFDQTTRQWSWLWLWVSTPLLVRGILMGNFSEAMLVLLNGIANVFVANFVRASHKNVVLGLGLILFSVAILGVVQNRFNQTAWYKQDGQVKIERIGLTHSVQKITTTGPSRITRYWSLTTPLTDLNLEFEARLVEGFTAWDWYRSESGVTLTPTSEDGRRYINIIGSDQNSYVVRHLEIGKTLPDRQIRIRFDARIHTNTRLGFNPIISFVNASGKAIREKSVSLTSNWQPYTLEELITEKSAGSRLSVTLSHIGDNSIDIRDFRLEEKHDTIWKEVGPMAPSGFDLTMMWPGTNQTTISLAMRPNDQWQKFSFPIHVPPEAATGTLASILHVGPNLTLEIQNANLKKPVPSNNNQTAGRITEQNPLSDLRSAFWFGHPNIAGHIIATIAMTVQILNRSMILALITFVLSTFDVTLTGSRTALIGIAASIPLIATMSRQSKRSIQIIVGIIIVLGLSTIIVSPQLITRLNVLEIGKETPRSTIWGIAWQAFSQHPWTGLTDNSFSTYFLQNAPNITNDAVQHAHNIWLEMAQRFGIAGLMSVSILTGGLLRIAWRLARTRGLGFVIPILIMNAFDTTLLQPAILCCLYLGLNEMHEPPAPK